MLEAGIEPATLSTADDGTKVAKLDFCNPSDACALADGDALMSVPSPRPFSEHKGETGPIFLLSERPAVAASSTEPQPAGGELIPTISPVAIAVLYVSFISEVKEVLEILRDSIVECLLQLSEPEGGPVLRETALALLPVRCRSMLPFSMPTFSLMVFSHAPPFLPISAGPEKEERGEDGGLAASFSLSVADSIYSFSATLMV